MGFLNLQRFSDGDLIDVAGHPVRLRINARARRISLRLDATRRQVVATAPSARRLTDAAAFARSRAGWIAGLIEALPQAPPLDPGQAFQVLGRDCVLETGKGRARLLDGDPLRLIVRDQESAAGSAVRVLKAEARRVLTERTEAHAGRLAQPLPVVSITDARSRWGSCKQPRRSGFGAGVQVGRIRYSWRLVLAPFEVMDYVAAHECAHLIEANHGPRFWTLVHELVGDHRPHRAWLRANAARLHAFGT